MSYQAKDYGHLLGATGLSDQLLKNHFTLYQGYVTNTNKLLDSLAGLLNEGKTGTSEYAELKRRFGWEWNGMRLHEYYFENMVRKGNPIEDESPLSKKLTEEYGSYEKWEKDFRATGSLRGIGWAALYLDTTSKRVFNTWINEHDTGHLTGCIPLLIMDVFEHAFIIDYGLKRAEYIEAFFSNIDWRIVSRRLME